MTSLSMIGATELWIILAVVLLVFGSRKLPELARAMGSSISQFKRGLADDPEHDKGKPELPKAARSAKDEGEERA